jgi:hypothetical protein
MKKNIMKRLIIGVCFLMLVLTISPNLATTNLNSKSTIFKTMVDMPNG